MSSACNQSSWTELTPGDVTTGTCTSSSQCQNNELCVDNRCEPYRWYRWPDEEPGTTIEPADTVSTEDTEDSGLDDVNSEETLADLPPEDASNDVDATVIDDVAPAIDAQKTVTAVIQDDKYEEGKGEKYVSLGLGEAWAADLQIPLTGSLVGLQAVVDDLLSDSSCGIFRVLLFEKEGEGFEDTPSWTSPETFELTGSGKPQYLFLEASIPLPKGVYRFGLLYEEACGENSKPPLLVTDKTGDVDTSWYWKETPGQSPWIPGSFLGLDGRWVLRVLLEVPI